MSQMLIKSPVVAAEPPAGYVRGYFNADPLTSFELKTSGQTTFADLQFHGSSYLFHSSTQSGFNYHHSAQVTVWNPLIAGTFSTGEYLVMYDNIVEIYGSQSNPYFQLNGSYNPGVWVEAHGAVLRVLDQSVNPPAGDGQVYSADVHFAQNNGSGSPVPGTTITKNVTFISWEGEALYTEIFHQSNGTDLNGATPIAPFPETPNTWSVLAGAMWVQSGTGKMNTGVSTATALAVLESGQSDIAWRAQVLTIGSDDVALVGRVQDSSNYWQLKIEDAETSDPVLKLNEVIGGVETTRASTTLTGEGPLETGAHWLRFTFNGNNILGVILVNKSGQYISSTTKNDCVWAVRYTSTSYNTETRFGIQSFAGNAAWDFVQGTFVEASFLDNIIVEGD